jgi:hypothetical protein
LTLLLITRKYHHFSPSTTIVMPALILLAPEFHVSYGSALNYGAWASTVGDLVINAWLVYWLVLKQKWCRFTLTRSLVSLDPHRRVHEAINGLQRMERGLYGALVRV